MEISYEGIGAVRATFLDGGVTEGQPVKLSAARTAAPCTAGDGFCGVCTGVRHGVCSVQVGGFVRVPYSGEAAPAAGYAVLTADGAGGVCTAAAGTAYLVADVDETNGVCVIKL